MNYSETLEYLFSRLPMFTRIGAAALKPDLTNTIALCSLLGNPQHKFKTIHVAGTNGKGSVSHMLASVLQNAGYKTGLYTSPHLKDFRERIRINGAMIPQQYVIDFVHKHKAAFEQIQPSFFEMTVALCFDYFAHENVEIAVIETGLGGRLDSTNIIAPELSVITNIGWDHTDLLGDTLAKIASEKAGIIKPHTPVVIGETQPETKQVFLEKAEQESAPVFFADEQNRCTEISFAGSGLSCTITVDSQIKYRNLFCELGGMYQQKNIITVIESVHQLQQKGFEIGTTHLYQGLAQVKKQTGLAGRWHQLGDNPLIICDTGHNVNGMEYVVKQLKVLPYKKLHMVIGMVKDKDITKVLALLPPNACYYFTQADLPRALDANLLQKEASVYGLKGVVVSKVSDALQAAKNNSTPEDCIFIGGSTFVVAEII
ncbi:MAG: bifunctional folylpolyglutamate synthase/dihydrofolate synthase [Bacteroidia bacterium]|nr:bifunctional folylpolyglutamate synthase/dihydrofolate synthase [Bacteroidia bacterium]